MCRLKDAKIRRNDKVKAFVDLRPADKISGATVCFDLIVLFA
jgi:hypothetical protein